VPSTDLQPIKTQVNIPSTYGYFTTTSRNDLIVSHGDRGLTGLGGRFHVSLWTHRFPLLLVMDAHTTCLPYQSQLAPGQRADAGQWYHLRIVWERFLQHGILGQAKCLSWAHQSSSMWITCCKPKHHSTHAALCTLTVLEDTSMHTEQCRKL
jgi:hypothetical protein